MASHSELLAGGIHNLTKYSLIFWMAKYIPAQLSRRTLMSHKYNRQVIKLLNITVTEGYIVPVTVKLQENAD